MEENIWRKRINIFIEALPNIVLILTVSLIIILFLNENILKLEFINKVYQNLVTYARETIFNVDMQDIHINLLTIIMGFVITIISVFGIGWSNAIIKICEHNLEDKFSFRATRIICVTMILSITMLFLYNELIKNNIIMLLVLSLEIFSILDFFVFGIIACKMFENNIKMAKDEYDSQNKKDEEIMYLLREIANGGKNNIGNYEQSKKKSEELRKIK